MTVVILASSSPRRTELLSAAGVAHEVVTPPPDINPPAGMPPEAAVALIAGCKAAAVAATSPPGACVIGADTMVVGPGGPLGKPGGPERARLMLRELGGREHTVLTGVSVRGAAGCFSGVSRSQVVMRALSDADIEAYIATGEPFDKAGGYAIQGRGEALVESVSGRIDTVIGLDVQLTRALLVRAGCPIALEPAADRPLRRAATGTSA